MFLSKLLANISSGPKQATAAKGTEPEPTPEALRPKDVRQAVFWQVWRWHPLLKWPIIMLAVVAWLVYVVWGMLTEAVKQKIVDCIWGTL